MTSSADEVATLTRWGAGLGRPDQDRLLLALASTLGSQRLGGRSRALLDRLLPALAEGADPGARRELVLRLSDAVWIPPALLQHLAGAADEGLLLLLAGLPALEDSVTAELAAVDAPNVQLALASNRRVRLSPDALARLVEASRRNAALRAPLARRPELTAAEAARLAGWSSASVRGDLTARFALAPTPPARAPEADTTRRLVEKLGRTGRLTPGYALSALRQGRLQVFEQAMAVLGGVPPEALRKANEADDPASLALACAAVGVDRAAFPEILREVRAANGGRPAEAPDASRAVMAAFARPPADAASALRAGFVRRSARWAVG